MDNIVQLDTFRDLSERVGRFDVRGKRFLIPEMTPLGSHLMAGAFRAFGINAEIMETYTGLDLGKKYTSGKECFPCVVTLGDILYFMEQEKKTQGDAFDPENYVYFMPETSGPCRFGMYNKYHRIILDSLPGLHKLKITALSSDDAYNLQGVIAPERMRRFRKTAFFTVVVGDVLERLAWRIRPYEKTAGRTDAFFIQARDRLAASLERHALRDGFHPILRELDEIVRAAISIIDPSIPRKPLIGVVGEIYVRTHTKSNQDTIKILEQYGAEVVNASISEWINFTTYEQVRKAKKALRLHGRNGRVKKCGREFLRYLRYRCILSYQYMVQWKVYRLVRRHIDIMEDHAIGHLEQALKKNDVFSFVVGTEACLSIASSLIFAHHGYNGIVNVFPFTCMPSNLTASITKPLMAAASVPYIDVSYDGSYQPGREAALRTFMYQAQRHCNAHGKP